MVQVKFKIKLVYVKCVYCMFMVMVLGLVQNVEIEGINFIVGSDVLIVLVFKSVDIVQVIYLVYVSGLDKGFDLVVVLGQVNGGLEMLVGKDSKLVLDDWVGFKKLIV